MVGWRLGFGCCDFGVCRSLFALTLGVLDYLIVLCIVVFKDGGFMCFVFNGFLVYLLGGGCIVGVLYFFAGCCLECLVFVV